MKNPNVHQKIKAFATDGLPNLKRVPIIVKRLRLGGILMIIHPVIAKNKAVLLKKKLEDQKFKKKKSK